MSPIRTRVSACAVALLFSVGCASTVQQKPQAPESLGFLSGVYDKLEPGNEGQLALRYVNRNMDWKQYKQVLLDPVQYWASTEGSMAPDVSQMLTTYFYNALHQNLEKVGVPLAPLPGPGVLRAEFALLDASSATPILRSVSVMVPQAILLNTAQSLFTDRYAFSGHIEVAMKVTDSRSGELLAAALDRRSGGVGIQQAAQWKWGDAEAAMDNWAEHLVARLQELRGQAKAK